jgi:hypothetical protein
LRYASQVGVRGLIPRDSVPKRPSVPDSSASMDLKAWILIFNLNSSNWRLMSWSAAINQVLELTPVEGDEVGVPRYALPPE